MIGGQEQSQSQRDAPITRGLKLRQLRGLLQRGAEFLSQRDAPITRGLKPAELDFLAGEQTVRSQRDAPITRGLKQG